MENTLGSARLAFADIKRLSELKTFFEGFNKRDDLNGFQHFIVSTLYMLDVPPLPFTPRGIIIAAIPHPFSVPVTLVYNGVSSTHMCPGIPDVDSFTSLLSKRLESDGYALALAPMLPLKRLAAQTGLSEYGRNNITYVKGMGSSIALMGYFTDMPCDGEWKDAGMAKACEHCDACRRACPTGAIREDRFLLDNQRCLSCHNEQPGEMPDFIPKDMHHTLYDCLICQRACPMNAVCRDTVAPPVSFNEEETRLMLAGVPREELTDSMRARLDSLGVLDTAYTHYEALPRNLRLLLRIED